MAANMRQRATGPVKYPADKYSDGPDESKTRSKVGSDLHWKTWVFILAFVICLGYFVHLRYFTLPKPKTVKEARPGEFVEERARNYLDDITGFGPREVGAEANEVLVVNYLLGKVAEIKKRKTPSHNLDVDVQLTTGSFTLKFLGEFSSVYENVKNVIVKFAPASGANDSLLVNCHYDTVLDSPGASDDAVTCCLMLEVLDVLAQSSTPLTHNVIFIFNGAEENILQASHGFITQHEWAKDVRAFVNLDSAGAGGRELLFQAGPEHPWLTQTYAQNVPHPFASVFGQEVFESGLIPSDTDFRIFRDYGNIPGLDIAYIHNGYVYHTKWDNPSMIPPGCVQRGGENLLALVKSLANSPLLADAGEYKHGSLVFFDVVGLFVVLYPARLGIILNVATVVFVLVGIMKKVMGKHKQPGIYGRRYLGELVKVFGVTLATWLATLVVMVCLGYVMMLVRPMSWYTRPLTILGLYVAPSLAVNLALHDLIKHKFYKNMHNHWEVEHIFFDATIALMSVVLALMTYKGLNSAVLFLVSTFLPLMLRDKLPTMLGINFREHHRSFVFLHLVSTAFPTLLELYFLHGILDMFIPVLGRIGAGIIPDVFIAAVMSFMTLLLFSPHTSLVYVTKHIRPVLYILGTVFLVTLGLVVFTPLGFPYRSDEAGPSRQRHILHHIDRTFHDVNGEISKKDSGLWLIPFDHYALAPLKGLVPLIDEAKPTNCEGPYCGWPFYFPMMPIMKYTFYIEGPQLTVEKPSFSVVSRKAMGGHERITMETMGPNHIIVYLSPKEGVNLTAWSVGNGVPHSTLTPPGVTQETYFIYYCYGTKPNKPWQFWIDVEVPDNYDRSTGVVDIAISGHYWFGDDRWTPMLKEFVDQLPDWTHSVAWSATYDAHVL